MILFESLLVAISTYSTIPVPGFEWNEKNMKYAICFLPLIGVFCGLLIGLTEVLSNALGVSGFLFAAIAVSVPLLITGGIHMDGFMDTVDALSSHQPRAKKLEILSDPHCGAFAVIYCGIYFILNMAVLYEVHLSGDIFVLCPIFVLSRCLSVLCAVNLPNARKAGMLSSYTEKTDRKAVNAVMATVAVFCVAGMALISFVQAITVIVSGALWTFIYCTMVKKQFGGVTGDTAGYFLQMFELVCMSGVWIGALI